jgi:hypothetical protein
MIKCKKGASFMAHCEYMDREKSFLDGTYCALTGGKVDDPDVVKYYCDSCVDCVCCPVRGGDDRVLQQIRERQKGPAPEPVHEEKRKYRGGDYGGSSGSGGSGGTGGSGRRSRGSSGNWVLSALGLGVLVLVVLLRELKLDIFKASVNLRMTLPQGVDRKKIVMESVSHDPRKGYKSYSGKMNKDGSCSVSIESGENSIYISYDGAKMFVGPAVGTANEKLGRPDYTYDSMCATMLGAVAVVLEDTDENPIPARTLELSAPDGATVGWINTAPGEFLIYILNLPDTAQVPDLTVKVEGYQPLVIRPDLSERFVGLKLTLEPEAQQTGGAQK